MNACVERGPLPTFLRQGSDSTPAAVFQAAFLLSLSPRESVQRARARTASFVVSAPVHSRIPAVAVIHVTTKES